MTKLPWNAPCILYAPRNRGDRLPWVLTSSKRRRRLVLARGATPAIVYGAALGLLHEREVRKAAFRLSQEERIPEFRGVRHSRVRQYRYSSLDEPFPGGVA